MSIHVTNRELDVMAVLWDRGSATVSEVRQRLAEHLAYTTILTVLRTLEARGYVRHEVEGKAYRYHPLIQPEQVGDRSLGRLLDKVYRGSRELLVTRLLSDKTVSGDELRRIRQMLDERLEEVGE